MTQSTRVWQAVCGVGEIPDGGAVVVPVTPPIAVFNVNGEFLATDDTCTHADFSLAEGYIEDDTVECSLHYAKFCLRTGKALTPPACVALATHEVRISGGTIQVDVGSRG
ncbi:3-phenylpropionate dioxygenase, putative ferredoxin subunit [Frankia canadensis]|uniref:3-phenylpropionate dioxygenase, putative ferredoxin subunit n=1 Tax=Frankia canadensis TaxID=1836972 RepID=A0A2I2KJL9_9ACTN|nr:bifunctional 3-phenylpropionate/cinnamic acid dioxygenase ferredoxin subunit [Frankia canadensis]SNQ45855.1 3-phenylpropionate dioxygenase, putative ferredoxin subunit [Frankia canadensis]SOU53145.1 3-phenylpropionate dioxygenase, putative ferredoxin subunit [Frankia canadensis]